MIAERVPEEDLEPLKLQDSEIFFSGFDFTIYERALNTPPNTPLRITAPSGFEHSSDIYDNHPALDYEIIPTP